ncbi:hypothetical protein Dimus_005933 [Dionaea muscipula]
MQAGSRPSVVVNGGQTVGEGKELGEQRSGKHRSGVLPDRALEFEEVLIDLPHDEEKLVILDAKDLTGGDFRLGRMSYEPVEIGGISEDPVCSPCSKWGHKPEGCVPARGPQTGPGRAWKKNMNAPAVPSRLVGKLISGKGPRVPSQGLFELGPNVSKEQAKEGGPNSGCEMFQVFQKLKKVKHRLKELHGRCYSSLDSRIELTRNVVLETREALKSQFTEDNWKILNGYTTQLREILKAEDL